MNSDSFPMSRYGQNSAIPSPVNRMMASFAGDFRDSLDINLGVGYVNENTIPRELINRAASAVLANSDRYRAPFNYGASTGSANLIRSLRRFLSEEGGGRLSAESLSNYQIAVGAAGATSILEGVAQLLRRGYVITSDPIYYIYSDLLERLGYRIIAVPEDRDGIRVDEICHRLQRLSVRPEEISFFIVVTVNNPSCVIVANQRREALVRLATRLSEDAGYKIPIFFDAAYESLVHDPSVPSLQSGLEFETIGNVFEIGTLSKILAPAMRVGYIVGPPGDFMNAVIQRTSDVGFSAPLMNQEICSYLLDHHIGDQLRSVVAGYRLKAERVKIRIDSCLGDYLESCSGGSAGFYFYLTFHTIETHERSRFFQYLTRTTGRPEIDVDSGGPLSRVIYVPGEYCVHREGDLVDTGKRQLRLSYGYEEPDRIMRGIELMKTAADHVS